MGTGPRRCLPRPRGCCRCCPCCCLRGCLIRSLQSSKYLKVIRCGLYLGSAVRNSVRHLQLYRRKVGPPWWLLILFPSRNTSNVLVMLQYDVTFSSIKTSGTFFMLNVLFVRY